jgi:4-hydroxy-2-oxoheptanedioate aldolase
MSLKKPPNPFLDKLRRGERCVGSFVFSSDPTVTEILGTSGLDVAIIDTEHAPLEINDVVNHGRAASVSNISWWVRVRNLFPADVGRLLDVGVQGIVLPHFGLDMEQTRRAASALKYSPLGTRPVCPGTRASAFDYHGFPDYVATANSDLLSVGLIEDKEAVENIEAVLDGANVDAVIPGGGGDLAASYGVFGEPNHALVLDAISRVVRAAKKRSRMKVGVFLSDLGSLDKLRDLEADFYIYAHDYKLLGNVYRHACAELAGTVAERI